MNRTLWEIVKAFIEDKLNTEGSFTIYSEELIMRFGLQYSFFDDMAVYAKEDKAEFEFSSPNYRPDMPSMGFDIVFEKTGNQA